jgi:hypothetical protein
LRKNARTHHSKTLKEWAEKNKDKIGLFYLSPYSPDLNPDEHVNSDVKYEVGSKVPKRTREGLQAATEEHMRMLKKDPGRIVKYFEDPAIQYAVYLYYNCRVSNSKTFARKYMITQAISGRSSPVAKAV